MKSNKNKNVSTNRRIIYLYDQAVITEFYDSITFDTVAVAYELLDEQIEISQALELELIKSKNEIQFWKDKLAKQKVTTKSLSHYA